MAMLLVIVLLTVPAIAAIAASGGIMKSIHDFSQAAWVRSPKTATPGEVNGVCDICHQAHNIQQQIVPLWAHETSKGPFTPYTSPSLAAQIPQPGRGSLACLRCHDGTVAVNEMAGKQLRGVESASIAPESLISPDLHITHPVSFIYDPSLAAKNGSLENPTTYRIGDTKAALTVSTAPVPSVWDGISLMGKTIDQALLVEHRMECSSCHDVHNMIGNAPASSVQLKITGLDAGGRNDLLCRTCHIK